MKTVVQLLTAAIVIGAAIVFAPLWLALTLLAGLPRADERRRH
jgi:hypothetical protein